MGLLDIRLQDTVQKGIIRQGIRVLLALSQLGRGRFEDRIGRNGFNLPLAPCLLIAPPGQLPDPGLQKVLDRSVPAHSVSVDGRIPTGQLGLIAGGQGQEVPGIGIGHDDDTTYAGLYILFGHTFQVQLLLEGIEFGADGLHLVMQAQPLGQVGRIVTRPFGGVPAGHGDAPYVGATAGIGGDCGHQSRVNPPGQSQTDPREMVLDHIVPQTEHTGPVDFLISGKITDQGGLGPGSRLPRNPRFRQGPVSQVLYELGGSLQEGTVGTYHEAPAIEDQVVLPSYLIDIDDRGINLASAPGRQIATHMSLALLEGGTVDGHQEVNALLGHLADGPALLPDILADGQTDTSAFDVENDALLAGSEDSIFVEDPVVGQEVLVIPGPHQTVVKDHHPVARPVLFPVRADGTDDDV